MATKLTGIEPGSAAIGSGGLLPSAQGVAGSPQQTPPAGSAPSSPNDVHITDTAAQLASLEQQLRAQPPIDAERVAAIGRAIDSGSYTVQPERIAAGLMRSEQTLGGITGLGRAAGGET